jgi:hypothetical protein
MPVACLLDSRLRAQTAHLPVPHATAVTLPYGLSVHHPQPDHSCIPPRSTIAHLPFFIPAGRGRPRAPLPCQVAGEWEVEQGLFSLFAGRAWAVKPKSVRGLTAHGARAASAPPTGWTGAYNQDKRLHQRIGGCGGRTTLLQLP